MVDGMSFEFDGELMEQRIEQIGPAIKRAMVAAAERNAAAGEAWMKTNAKWTDRTSNARNGLQGRTQISKNFVRIIYAHSVPYGIWLEVRWSGRYAIIKPAVDYWAPKTFELIARLAFR